MHFPAVCQLVEAAGIKNNIMQIQQILNEGTVEGNIFKLPAGQLDRKTYEGVAKALQGIGGKWKGGKVMGFEFSNPSWLEDLERIRGGESVNLQKAFQFFETPAAVLDLMQQRIEAWKESAQYSYVRALEPSAGMGAIVKMLQRVGGFGITAAEVNPRMAGPLVDLGVSVLCPVDFLKLPTGTSNWLFDVIAANPPFTKNQDVKHFMHMERMLAVGGILACVMSKHWTFAEDRESREFLEFLVDRGAEIIPIPAGAFKESGTMIETVLVVLKN
jgi:hypothetical protein